MSLLARSFANTSKKPLIAGLKFIESQCAAFGLVCHNCAGSFWPRLRYKGDSTARLALFATAASMSVLEKPIPVIAAGVLTAALVRYLIPPHAVPVTDCFWQ